MSEKLSVLTKAEVETTEELERLAARIAEWDAGVRDHFGHHIVCAYRAGFALIRAKELLPHGQFIPWRERVLPHISRSSASRYVQFAERLQVKYPPVGSLDSAKLLTAGNELPKGAGEVLLKAIYDESDCHSLTELFRDLGIIRPKKPNGALGHGPPVKLSAREQHELEVALAVERCGKLLTDMRGTTKDLLLIPVALAKELDGERIDFGHRLAPIVRSKTARRKRGKEKKGKDAA